MRFFLQEQIESAGRSVDDVARLEILTFPEALSLYQKHPANSDQAQYNICFGVASMLVMGFVDVTEAAYKENQKIAQLLAKTVARIHQKFEGQRLGQTKTHDNCAEVRAHLCDGTVLSSGLRHVEWDTFKNQPAPSDQDLIDKFIFSCHNASISDIELAHVTVQEIMSLEAMVSADCIEAKLSQLQGPLSTTKGVAKL